MKHYELGNPKPEIIIALAGPAGTSLEAVVTDLAEQLRGFRYYTIPIRVSQLLKEWCSDEVKQLIEEAKEDKRIDYSMNAADLLRESVGSGAALVPLIATAIRHERQRFLFDEGCHNDYEEIELYNHCFVINSLKHPDEVRLLRRIYGNKFIMMSAFSSLEARTESLSKLIAKSYAKANHAGFVVEAEGIIEKDKKRSDSDIGQNLSSTFHLGDFFIRADGGRSHELKRFLEILFGHPNATPKRDEYLMFEASANALRSADLSRQVGAVITNGRNEIVSRGSNEVPVVGGDAFWPGSKGDDTRDYAKGKDFNAVKKTEILKELLDYLSDSDVVSLNGKSSDDVVSELVNGKHKRTFRDLRISNLIEFGRMVHAEMFALMEAARRGLSVEKGTLYCTTFPCHMCARHIISAGIQKVFYIEPYPKSMTEELYDDMICVDADPKKVPEYSVENPKMVYFQPFEGIAPRIYSDAYIMTKRKNDDGYRVDWNKNDAKPKWIPLSKSHLELEVAISHALLKIQKVADVKRVKGV